MIPAVQGVGCGLCQGAAGDPTVHQAGLRARPRPRGATSSNRDWSGDSVRPPACSTYVFLRQDVRSQKNRRTRSLTCNFLPTSGRSAKPSSYDERARRARAWQPGHLGGGPHAAATTTRTSATESTRSGQTTISENSTSCSEQTPTAERSPGRTFVHTLAVLGIH